MYNYTNGGVQTESLKNYAAKTFGWMFLGLALTFGIMMGAYLTGLVVFFLSPIAILALTLAEFGTVIVLSRNINKLSVGAARGLFFLYAILNGLVFSTLFLAFDVPALMLAFGVTAVYFGVMSAVGYFTQVDLTALRPILVGGLILLLIFNVLGMFFGFGGYERLICFAGVAVFLGFTAYDTQKIKAYYAEFEHNPEMLARAGIIAALALYLDFVNLFLYILRLFNGRD